MNKQGRRARAAGGHNDSEAGRGRPGQRPREERIKWMWGTALAGWKTREGMRLDKEAEDG